MDAYQWWNDAIAKRFFNEDMAGRNVHLYINQVLVDEMDREREIDTTFRVAVAGPPNSSIIKAEDVCRRALEAFTDWRATGAAFPPYIGYLGFFILAGDIDGDFAPNAYYPRLWELLVDERRDSPVPAFERMHELWEDLEDWAVHDRKGELGLFQARSIGGYVRIGYPLSQSLLVEQERRDLPKIFYEAGLDPTTEYPADALARELRTPAARQLLRRKTVNLLENRQDNHLYYAVLDAVVDELLAWDGAVPEQQPTAEPASTLAGLRLCIDLDRVAGIARSSIRCKLNREFPEDGLIINDEYEAMEAGNGWSMPVTNRSTGEILDASLLDWQQGTRMRATSHNWQLRLQAREVRIFASGLPEGISGFVETHALPLRQPFHLAYSEEAWPRLKQWATEQCQGFREVEITRGLPEGWQLASIDGVADDSSVKDAFPTLSFRSGAPLRLVGGIRHGSGNNFFNFAPPRVALTSSAPNDRVYCNGMPLLSSEDDGVYDLPHDLPSETRISLDSRESSESQAVSNLSLFLTGDFGLPSSEPTFSLNPAGSAGQPGDEVAISGAYIRDSHHELAVSAAELFEDLAYEMGGVQGYLIGSQPGQIVSWPAESFPTQWIPAWAVKKQGKKLTAVFIEEDLKMLLHDGSAGVPTRREIQNWKQVLWHRRKRITPPRSPAQRILWQQIREAARNVR